MFEQFDVILTVDHTIYIIYIRAVIIYCYIRENEHIFLLLLYIVKSNQLDK